MSSTKEALANSVPAPQLLTITTADGPSVVTGIPAVQNLNDDAHSSTDASVVGYVAEQASTTTGSHPTSSTSAVPAEQPSTTTITHPTSSPDVGIPTTLHGFKNFPLEVRLMIWALAAPPPAVIVQCKSRIEGRPFFWNRAGGVPAVLHACRESRAEYLEIEPSNDAERHEIEARRRKHPLYKMTFRTRRLDSPGCYMALEIDTYMPLDGEVFRWKTSKFRTASMLRFLKEVKYLAVGNHHVYHPLVVRRLVEICPQLRCLTITLWDESFDAARSIAEQYGAEVDGEWGLELSTRVVDPIRLEGMRQSVPFDMLLLDEDNDSMRVDVSQEKRYYPNTIVPPVKFRFAKQFIHVVQLDTFPDMERLRPRPRI
ncbi:uncharacterized protein LY89DRAFT_672712 [Mollisia scopiformis]|uniref:2EXR domain-containing protein n=1 Tax=Mollisia scopiformis TaxID=149040 RepID=A0A194X0M1_MOLSC|nr:uncharacterized protein LY89DRAFT_672712 [Mollisia scopiformis]KUJ13504.1 hypothetical protein LY89DRAFT_672712 [Mollisia scopiformis]